MLLSDRGPPSLRHETGGAMNFSRYFVVPVKARIDFYASRMVLERYKF